DRRDGIAAQQDLSWTRQRLTCRIEARDDVVEELRRRADVVAKAETFERRPVDEDDLRANVDLRLAQIEAARVLLELSQRRRDIRHADRVRDGIGRHRAAHGAGQALNAARRPNGLCGWL